MMFPKITDDGSDIGVLFSNPDNIDEWSTIPYLSQIREIRLYDNLINHIAGKRTIQDELGLIKNKQSTLPKSVRDYTIKLCKGFD